MHIVTIEVRIISRKEFCLIPAMNTASDNNPHASQHQVSKPKTQMQDFRFQVQATVFLKEGPLFLNQKGRMLLLADFASAS